LGYRQVFSPLFRLYTALFKSPQSKGPNISLRNAGRHKTLEVIFNGFPPGAKEPPYQGIKQGGTPGSFGIGKQLQKNPLGIHPGRGIKRSSANDQKGVYPVYRTNQYRKRGIIS
jgi:hypothetical protein